VRRGAARRHGACPIVTRAGARIVLLPSGPLTDQTPVPFVDLVRLHGALEAELDAGWRRVLRSGRYHLGPETSAFEAEFAAHEGAAFGVACGSGSDALFLAMRALDIGPGDAVATPSNSFVATSESIARTGADVLLVDADPVTRSLDLADLARLLDEPAAARLRAVIPVHLYGRRADIAGMRRLLADAGRGDVRIIGDAAQAHGSPDVAAEVTLTTYSFYPAKNLGALGDAGIVLSNDAALAERIRSLRNHGRAGKHQVGEVGLNSRFDEVQAATLRAKLPHLRSHNAQRRAVAAAYRQGLADLPGLTVPPDGEGHVFHLFVVEVDSARRDRVVDGLKARGVGVGLHYPVAVHQMAPYRCDRPLPVSERLAARTLSLPMFPGMTGAEVARVCASVRSVLMESGDLQ
jgi:dTDP-4-amino-4,6-dideoxygalactose transaminase